MALDEQTEEEEEEDSMVMPRRVFETIECRCQDTLKSPHASATAKAGARSRVAQVLYPERRGGVG